MKKLLTFLVATALVGSINAQAPVIQWQQSYGGTSTDAGATMQITTDSGYVFAGRSTSNDVNVSGNHGGSDWWVYKTDNLGTIQWQKSIGGSNDDVPYNIIQTSDGGYAIAGWTESSDGDVSGYQGNKDCWVVKLDNAGVIQWQKSLGGTSEEEFRYIIQTSDGGYACSGWSYSNDGDVSGRKGIRDGWLVKLDASGNLSWQRMLGGNGDENGYTVEQTTDGGYIFSAVSTSNSGGVAANYGLFDYWLAKTDASGNVIWEKNYGGSSIEQMRSCIQTSDGGYIMTGYTFSSDIDVTGFQGVSDIFVVKVTTLGAIEWTKTYGGSQTDRASRISQTTDGGYIIAGLSNSADGDVTGYQGGFGDSWMIKINNIGTIEWQKTLGGTGDEQGSKIIEIQNGYLFVGNSTSNDGDVDVNLGDIDIWFTKLLFNCAPGSITASISGNESICTGQSANLTIDFTGNAPFLYSINGGPVQSSNLSTTVVSVSPVANTTYNLTYYSDNLCPNGTTSGSAEVLVSTTGPLNTAKILSGPSSTCTGNIEYFTARVVTGQNIRYVWTGPAGALFSTSNLGPFSAGPYSTIANEVYMQTGPTTPNVTGYTVCVKGSNGCGQTNTNCYSIRSLVSVPAPITGSVVGCPGTTQTYSVNVPAGAELFTWTFSVPGAVITPLNLLGNIVEVTFPAYTTGNLCVTASLACGGTSSTGSRCLTISASPTRPGVLSGVTSLCGGSPEVYSVVPVPGATSYTWSFPYAGTTIDGNPSPYTTANNSVTISVPSGYNQNQSVCVIANSACGASTPRCKTINNQIPLRPNSIFSSPAIFCNNSPVEFSVAPVAGATAYNWTLSNGTISSGQGTNAINSVWGTGQGNVTVNASNSCGSSSTLILNIIPNCRLSFSGAVTSSDKFQIYPNPARTSATIQFNGNGSNQSMRIIDMKGQLVMESSVGNEEGPQQIEINLTGVQAGIYIVELTTELQTERARLVVE
ncbi:MAG: T9SS type A sorting domain-containing protein [Bacteroidetes bacterium]|nr:T9SS type A sorting domain-containing protein [Bacteroidota bacterium]